MVLVIAVILGAIRIQLILETALVLGALTAALIAFYLGYGWEDIEKGMLDGIRHGLTPCIILIVVGMVCWHMDPGRNYSNSNLLWLKSSNT